MSDLTWISIEEATERFHVTAETLLLDNNTGAIDSKKMRIRGETYLHFPEHQLARRYERRLTRKDWTTSVEAAAVGVAAGLAANRIDRALKNFGTKENEEGRLHVIIADPNETLLNYLRDMPRVPALAGKITMSTCSNEFGIIPHIQKVALRHSSILLFLEPAWGNNTLLGPKMINALKVSRELWEKIYLVAYSCNTEEDFIREVYEAGANLFVGKSSFPEEEIDPMVRMLKFFTSDDAWIFFPGGWAACSK